MLKRKGMLVLAIFFALVFALTPVIGLAADTPQVAEPVFQAEEPEVAPVDNPTEEAPTAEELPVVEEATAQQDPQSIAEDLPEPQAAAQAAVNAPDPTININSTYAASYSANPGSHPTAPVALAFDNDFATRWSSSGTTATATVEVLYNNTCTINQVKLKEYWSRISNFELQYLTPGTTDQWQTFYTGTTLGHDVDVTIEDFGNIEAAGLRIFMTKSDASLAISLYEFQAYYAGEDVVKPKIVQMQIANSDHALMILTESGHVYEWGKSPLPEKPTRIPELDNIVMIATSQIGDRAAALKSDGTVWTWQLSSSESIVPKQFQGLDQVKSIAVGTNSYHALKQDGTLWAWGYNAYGVFGTGSYEASSQDENIPVQTNVVNVEKIVAGSTHCLALKKDGTAWAWGGNNYYQIGVTKTQSTSIPQQIWPLTTVTDLFTSPINSYFISDKGLFALGSNSQKQITSLSTDAKLFNPTQFQFSLSSDKAKKIKKVAGGGFSTRVLFEDGTIFCRGDNTYSQLRSEYLPSDIIATDIEGGSGSTMLLDQEGHLWVMGLATQHCGNTLSASTPIKPVQLDIEF